MGTANAIVSARPQVHVDGNRQEALEAALLSLSARLTEGEAADLQAEFANWGTTRGGSTGFTLFGGDVLDFGKRIEIRSGSGVLFSGRILGFEGKWPEMGPPTLVVRADDGFQDLRMVRRTRSFDRQSESDILRRIASDHGLTADLDLPDARTLPVVVQSNQSDLAFARERARMADADLWLEDGKMKVRSRRSRSDCGFGLAQGSNLLSFQVAADLAHQRTSLVVAGWDVSRKAAVSQSADSSVLGTMVDPSGKSGPQVLQSALGDRVETVVHRGPWDDQDATAQGKAFFSTLARSFLRGRGRAVADSRLLPGRTVKVDGVGPWFSGDYGISEVQHRFDMDRGLWSEVELERAWIGVGP